MAILRHAEAYNDPEGFGESAAASRTDAYSRALEYAIVLAAFLLGLGGAILFEKVALSEDYEPSPVTLVGV
jgi:hypothetical protein